MNNLDIVSILINIIALMVAIIPHEIAHGYVAYLCGDTTAKDDGRLSLNPLHHIDPVGLISMVIFRFGWAKAVPINPYRFKGNRKVASLLVSLAGVFTNFVLGLISGIILVYLNYKSSAWCHFSHQSFGTILCLASLTLCPFHHLMGQRSWPHFCQKIWNTSFIGPKNIFILYLSLIHI